MKGMALAEVAKVSMPSKERSRFFNALGRWLQTGNELVKVQGRAVAIAVGETVVDAEDDLGRRDADDPFLSPSKRRVAPVAAVAASASAPTASASAAAPTAAVSMLEEQRHIIDVRRSIALPGEPLQVPSDMKGAVEKQWNALLNPENVRVESGIGLVKAAQSVCGVDRLLEILGNLLLQERQRRRERAKAWAESGYQHKPWAWRADKLLPGGFMESTLARKEEWQDELFHVAKDGR